MWLDLGLKEAVRVPFLSSCFVLLFSSMSCLVSGFRCGEAPSPSSAVASWQALGKEEELF